MSLKIQWKLFLLLTPLMYSYYFVIPLVHNWLLLTISEVPSLLDLIYQPSLFYSRNMLQSLMVSYVFVRESLRSVCHLFHSGTCCFKIRLIHSMYIFVRSSVEHFD